MNSENTAREQKETQDHVSTNTITDTRSGELLVTSDIFTPQFAGRTHQPTFSDPMAYLRNQAQKPQCADFTWSVSTSLSPCTAPQAQCVWPAATEQQHNTHLVLRQSPGSSLGCSAALKAAVLRHHHTNEKNLVAGTEYQNDQFLFLCKVCPFLSAFSEIKMNSPEV